MEKEGRIALIGGIRMYFKNLYESRYVIVSLVKKDLRAKYRGSVLGILWSLVTPLGTTLIIALVYSILWKSDIHYFVPYLFSGLTPWAYITECGMAGASAYTAAEGYIKQLPVHIELFPVRCATVAFVNLLFSLMAYFLVVICLNPGLCTWWTLMLIPALFVYYVFGVALSTLAASGQVYTKDYTPTQSLLFQAFFYVTPIIYDFSTMKEMGYSIIYEINPFFYLLQVMRDALMGKPANGTYWLVVAGIVLAAFALSQYVFYRTRKKIVFRL